MRGGLRGNVTGDLLGAVFGLPGVSGRNRVTPLPHLDNALLGEDGEALLHESGENINLEAVIA